MLAKPSCSSASSSMPNAGMRLWLWQQQPHTQAISMAPPARAVRLVVGMSKLGGAVATKPSSVFMAAAASAGMPMHTAI